VFTSDAAEKWLTKWLTESQKNGCKMTGFTDPHFWWKKWQTAAKFGGEGWQPTFFDG
jgi:hypothetical protein